MAIQRVHDLEIDQDLVFERRSHRVEQVGLGLMVALVLAAALGLLGSGPLSAATARGDALAVEFHRFSRYQSSETLRVRLDGRATSAPEVRVWIDRAYLDGARLESVLPAPVRVEGAADRLVFVFAVADRERPVTIDIVRQPERIGRSLGRVGLEGPIAAEAVTFRQFVFP